MESMRRTAEDRKASNGGQRRDQRSSSSAPGKLWDDDVTDCSQFIHANFSRIADDHDWEMEGDDESAGAEAESETTTAIKNVRSQSGSTIPTKEVLGSIEKRRRMTLTRGGACVACRNRKLKCTGDKPCKACVNAKVECRYEEIQRKKPRAALLEERILELEALLNMRGKPIPPRSLATAAAPWSHLSLDVLTPHFSPQTGTDESWSKLSPLVSGQTPTSSLHSRQDLPPNHVSMNASIEIPPNSPLEHALIEVVLPYTPHLFIPVHPQRFLALLTLPRNHPRRPHPALLYILFAEAVRILEGNIPRPQLPRPPPSLFPQSFSPPMPGVPVDPGYILSHVHGTSLSLLQRARTELDNGIRHIDRPYDLVRAAVGVARYLYSLGRFIEGWNIQVGRLLISCGLHRMKGTIPPAGGAPGNLMPQPFIPEHFYGHSRHSDSSTPAQISKYPLLRISPDLIPPAEDEIEMTERNMTFWAAKVQDWAAGIGWGWTTALADDECTTEWPWGWGSVEIKPPATSNLRWNIRDLHDPTSTMQTGLFPDTTFTLAIKSIGLLHRASRLFYLPEPPNPVLYPGGQMRPKRNPTLSAVRSVRTALRLFRRRIPPVFADRLSTDPSNSPLAQETYDGMADPWWILCHMNLYTAEMMMWIVMAHHRSPAYETAVSCARAIVGLVRRMRPESWVHLNMIAALDLSLVSTFLFKESDRLAKAGQIHSAAKASEEAEILRTALARDYSKWLPMASTQALIVQCLREEKELEYDGV